MTEKYIIMRKLFLCLLPLFICFPSAPQQMLADPVLRVVPQEETVYVYHTHRLPLGHGFHIYRQDEPGGEFVRLNERVVRGARRADDVRPMLDHRYDDVLDLFDAQTPSGLWINMQGKRFEAGLASFLYPEAAKVLGRLYVDHEAPTYEEVTYRMVFVNSLDNPTGKELQKTVELIPHQPAPPEIIAVDNTGNRVTIQWHYPMIRDVRDDDHVIQFYVFRLNQQEEPEFLDHRVVVRNNAVDTHQLTFESPVMNTTENYMVTAVSVTGLQSEPSNVFTYELLYNIPPRPVYELSADVTTDPWVVLGWQSAKEPEIRGYNVYRSSDLLQPFELLTRELVSVGQTFYLDSTVTGGETYFYHVTVVDRNGNESNKGTVSMADVPDLVPPPKPEGLAAEYNVETEQVDLAWEMPYFSDNFETFLLLRRREDVDVPGAFNQANREDLTDTRFSDAGDAGAGFLEGGSYRYVLYSSSTSKKYSDTVSIVIDIPVVTPPEVPRGLRAVNDNGFRVTLNWSGVSSLNLEKYALFRKMEGEEDFRKIREVPLTTRFFRDEDVESGNTYVYAVQAIDVAGNESAFSEPASLFFRNYSPPRQVRNIQAMVTDEGVQLQWERVTADDFAGYKVYRATIPTGVYEPLHDGLIEATRFTDEVGDAGSWYRVRAVDTSGNESRPGNPVRPVNRNN